MDLGLKGKVALVTAASKGLGKAIALELAAEGAKVAICSRSADALKLAAAEIKKATGKTIKTYATDLTDAAAVKKMVNAVEKDVGPIDILVNSSGGAPTRPFKDLTDEDWQKALDVKFMAEVRATREVFPRMVKRGGGRVVFIIGTHAFVPHAYAITAGVVNAALANLTKALAEEGAPHNVLVNAVNPGPVLTDRILYLAEMKAKEHKTTVAEAKKSIVKDVLLKRFGLPEDIAAMTALVVSGRGGFITGALINVDGGMASQM